MGAIPGGIAQLCAPGAVGGECAIAIIPQAAGDGKEARLHWRSASASSCVLACSERSGVLAVPCTGDQEIHLLQDVSCTLVPGIAPGVSSGECSSTLQVVVHGIGAGLRAQ